MRKNWKRLLAFVLAIVLIMTNNAVTGNDSAWSLKANAATNTYEAYFYSLLPDKIDVGIENATGNVSMWNGMGVGKISGENLKAATGYSNGYQVPQGTYTITAPTANYPSIWYNGKTYAYDATGTKENSYSITWSRVIVGQGIQYEVTSENGVKKEHADMKAAYDKLPWWNKSQLTFHVDGVVTLRDKELKLWNVKFWLQEPGVGDYALLADYARVVEEGVAESALSIPSTGNKTVNGITYEFDGWYTDSACTQKADFAGTIQSDVNYYGRYVEKKLDNQVTITAITTSKSYDGTPLTAGATATGLESGHSVVPIMSTASTITEVGSVDNIVDSYQIVDASGNDVTYRYKSENIAKVPGKLTVTPRTGVEVTITENSKSYSYDGTEKTVTGYTVTGINDSLYNESYFTFSGDATAKGTNVDTYNMEVKAEDFTNTNRNFDKVTFKIVDGALKITPNNAVEVTITENSASYTYDGEEKIVTGYEVTNISDSNYTVADFTFKGEAVAKGTAAGTYAMNVQAGDFTNTNPNYGTVTFKVVDGQLNIGAVTDEVIVTIAENSGSYTYDGTAKTVTGYEVTNISNPLYKESDFTFNGTASISGTDVGTYNMEVKAEDFVNNNGNFANVKFNIVPGTLTIHPVTDAVTVTVTENSGEYVYDGTEKTVTGYTVTNISNALYQEGDFTYNGEAVARGTEVGSYDMKVVAENFVNNNKNFTNVSFVVNNGKLNITPVATEVVVTITENSGEYVYNGAEQSVTGYTVTSISNDLYKATDFTYNGEAVAKGTAVGSYDMAVEAASFANTNKNFTNVTFQVVDGKLNITPVADEVVVTVTENSGNYTYDGTEKIVTGYVVTDISNDLYTEADFTFNGEAVVKGTEVGSYDMAVVAENFANTSANFANVTFKVVDGKLTIAPVTEPVVVRVKENSGSYTYDGTEKTVTGYTVTSISNAAYKATDFTFNGEAVAKGTNVGTYDLAVKASDFTNTNTRFTNVVFMVEDGQMTIAPSTEKVTVTVTENSGKYIYDGTEKTVTGYKVTDISNALYAETDFTFGGEAEVKGTEAGSYAMEVKASDFINTNKNFANVEFVVVDGKLTIDPVETEVVVTVTERGGSYTYDGTEKTVTGYDVTDISSSLYTEGDFTFSGEAVVKGTAVGTYDMAVKAEDFTNTNDNFTNVIFRVVDAQLEIAPVTEEVVVVITENGGTYTYDGNEKSVEGYDVASISNSLYTEADFTFSGEAIVKGTDAGTYEMAVESGDFTNTNKNFTNVTFQVVDGQMVIDPIAEEVVVTITENSGAYTYDAAEKSVSGYEVTSITNSLYTEADFTFSGAAEVKGTDVGSYDMEVESGDFTNQNKNFSNVTFVIVNGQLVINPVDEVTVIITENSGEFEYDGTEKEVTGYTVTSISNDLYTAADFTFSGEAVAKGTAVGSYDMAVAAEDFTNTNTSFSKVTFQIVDGQLTVVPSTEEVVVTITENSGDYVYDGTEKSVTGYTVTDISSDLYTEADFTFNGTASVVGTTVGNYDMSIQASDFVNNNTSFSKVTFVVVDGQLNITPAVAEVVVTVTENSATYEYDGTQKTVTGYSVTDISNALYTEADFIFGGVAEAKGTEAGSYDMEVKGEDFTNNNANFSKVTFKVVDGQLTITPVDDEVTVTVTEKSGSYVYDGTEKTVSGYEVTDISNDLYTAADFTFNGEAVAKGTNAGTYDMAVEPGDFSNTSNNFSKVTFVVEDGQLNITPVTEAITVNVKENSGSYVYDGTEKTVSGYTVTSISNSLYTEADFDFNGLAEVKGTDMGIYDMEVMATDFANTSVNFTNVSFVVEDGQLIISSVADEVVVTITENSGSYVYDGTEKTVSGYTVTNISNTLYTEADFSFNGVAEAKGTQVGIYDMEVESGDFTNHNTNFSKVSFVVVDGQLNVTPVTDEVIVTVTENSGSYVYDGTEKAVSGYVVSSISNDLYTGADFSFNGVAEAKGTDAGSYDMEVESGDFINNSNNFSNVTFQVVDGQLTITPVADEVIVTVTENSASYEYDGTEKSVADYVVTHISNALYSEADFSFGGEAEAKGTNVGSYDMEVESQDFTNTSNNFSNVTFQVVDGQLTITPVADEVIVTVTENSGNYTYDGTEKTVNGYEVTNISNSLYTEADFSFNGNASVAATEAGTYQMEVLATDFANTSSNFSRVTFVVNDGQMVIAPIEEVTVVVTENSGSYTYDGTEKTVSGYTVTSISNALYTEADFSFNGSANVVGTAVGTYDMEVKAEDFVNNNKNFSKVTFVVNDGQMVIAPIDEVTVIVTENSGSYTYDGKEKTVSGYEVTSISNALYTEADFTFNGTASVVGTEAGIYDMEVKAEDFTNTSKSFSKVTFVVVDGMLTVTPVTDEVIVTIAENSGNYVYDGTEKTVSGYEVSAISNALYSESDFTFSGDANVVATDAGTYEMNISDVHFQNTNANFGNVIFDVIDGQLDITKRAVTLTSASAAKEYDGEALTNSEVTVGGDGWAVGEGATYQMTGSQTEVGNSLNSFAYTLNAGTNANNYEITTAFGTLEVTPVEEYNLTIHYVSTTGTTLAPDYNENIPVGDAFSVVSPTIEGYTPNYASISSDANGMPAADLEITVVYTVNAPVVVPTPQGPTPTPTPDDTPDEPVVIEPVVLPVDGTPDTPDAPVADTPVPVAPVEPVDEPLIEDVQEPVDTTEEAVDVVVMMDEDGNAQLVTIEDNETPLANVDLGDHECNVSSLLLLLATLLVLIAYTKQEKKHQKKMFEMKEKLRNITNNQKEN